MSDTLYQYEQDGIQFNGVKEPGIAVQNAIITTNNNYKPDERRPNVISGKKNNIINAIDIDWNAADVNLINNSVSINTTGQMLKLYKDGINTSYSLANAAYNLADDAYDKAMSAQTGGMSEDEIKNYINSQISSNVVTSLTNNTNNRVTGDIKLTSSISETDLPISIYQGTGQFSFGISKNTLLSYLKTTDLGGGGITEDQLVGLAGDHLEFENGKFNVIDLPKSINYSAGNGINIDDNHVISVNTDIATKKYVDTKKIKVGTAYPIYDGADSTHDSLIRLDYAGDTFTLKDGRTLDLSQTILNKINSSGGQGIEYNSGTGINVNNTNHTISINNTVALKSEIPNVSNYLTKSGNTTGTLAVINGLQVNESNATTDGNDIYISSDRKLKDNILDIRQDEVDKLFATESGNMHYFEWKENHKPSFGFIAQELMDFAPETVTKDSEYMQVNYNAALTKTCAALFKKIKQLEKRIKILEGES